MNKYLKKKEIHITERQNLLCMCWLCLHENQIIVNNSITALMDSLIIC